MCAGIALARSELPTELLGRRVVERRVHDRGGESEVQFHYRDRRPKIPVWHDGRLILARWGNGRGQSRYLPRTGWTWLDTIESGGWRNAPAVGVDIPVSLALDRGVWLRPFRNLVYAMPPFICTPDEIAQVTSAMVEVARLTGSRRL